MNFIRWDNNFSVGIDRIDEEHKKLIGLINRLYESMEKNKQGQVLGDIFDELSDYTRIHFASEEKLFAQYAYPETAEHTAEHARLIRELVDLRENPHVSSNLLSLEMMEFLRDWLSVHILEQDKAYSAFLISKGAK